jgi:dsDNA-specific endonuclease/ATPase MutS2
MRRVSPHARAAQDNRAALLATQPGQKVFVVPFNKSATLIRIKPDKDQAVVQSGAFEMELPLADLAPMHPRGRE